MSVPNQKKVKIAPRIKRDRDHLFAMMNIEALQLAMQNLKGSALKMWLYFNKNQDNYEFELSQKACSEWGIKKDSYYSGVEELIKKGYLIPIVYGSNIYTFYEIPQLEKVALQKATLFSEIDNCHFINQTEESQIPERNNTNITDIKQNKTINDDNAKGVIVDCGSATIQKEESFDEKMKRWFGSYKQEYVCEAPHIFINKYF